MRQELDLGRPNEPLSLGTRHRHVHFLKRYLVKAEAPAEAVAVG